MSKRSFLKLGLGGTAALFVAPLLRPRSLWATPVLLPPDYLESRVHAQWMKLSYNGGLESRQTRRTLGAGLRHIGAARGAGEGRALAGLFDAAVDQAYARFQATGQRPGTLLGLVQWMYDDFILPEHGPAAGATLYAVLLSMVRARDGSAGGEVAHRQYLAHREAALWHKNVYRLSQDPEDQLKARWLRADRRLEWQQALLGRAEVYASGRERLNANHLLDSQALAGWDLEQAVARVVSPRLRIARVKDQVVVSWEGPATLQIAPNVDGPWTAAGQDSPAVFGTGPDRMFFRTIHSEATRER